MQENESFTLLDFKETKADVQLKGTELKRGWVSEPELHLKAYVRITQRSFPAILVSGKPVFLNTQQLGIEIMSGLKEAKIFNLRTFEIGNITVYENYRGQGNFTEFMKKCLELFCEPDNRSLYIESIENKILVDYCEKRGGFNVGEGHLPCFLFFNDKSVISTKTFGVKH